MYITPNRRECVAAIQEVVSAHPEPISRLGLERKLKHDFPNLRGILDLALYSALEQGLIRSWADHEQGRRGIVVYAEPL